MLNFYRLPQDYLKFEGAERLDLINRLSTNSVNTIEEFGAIKTILTSDKGRFVDILHLFNFGDFVFSTCSFNNCASVAAHLDKYTIMDDFKCVDMSGTHETLFFYGIGVTEYLDEVSGVKVSSLNENSFKIVKHEGHDAIIIPNDETFGGYLVIYAIEGKAVWEKLLFSYSAIANYGISEVNNEDFNSQRILYGIPKFPNEMSELTNPLECGLNKYVSFTKGCYIGQEVIARLDAYDKISKHMVGITSNGVIALTEQLGTAKITLDGKECGFVTSAGHSVKHGNIGLGFVKTIFLDYSKHYSIKSGDNLTDCRIIKLPFS